MSLSVKDIDIFKLTGIQDKSATLYHDQEKDQTYIYIGPDRYDVPLGSMAFAKSESLPLAERFQGFRFTTNVRVDGVMSVFQADEHYMVMFAAPKFLHGNEDKEAVNDVILVQVGNALKDLDK